MKKIGFTLIELLVVIAIIAILAAILFPVFITAKARSRTVQCSNNLKQITTAMLMYADDWQGRLPGLNALGDVVNGKGTFSQNNGDIYGKGPLWKYLKAKGVYVCPDDLLHRKPTDTVNEAGGGLNYTYTMNSYMTIAGTNRRLANICGEMLTKSQNPGKTILLVDENTDPKKNASVVNDLNFASGDKTGDRHPGGVLRQIYKSGLTTSGCATVSYLDSHVGTVPGLVQWDEPLGKELFQR